MLALPAHNSNNQLAMGLKSVSYELRTMYESVESSEITLEKSIGNVSEFADDCAASLTSLVKTTFDMFDYLISPKNKTVLFLESIDKKLMDICESFLVDTKIPKKEKDNGKEFLSYAKILTNTTTSLSDKIGDLKDHLYGADDEDSHKAPKLKAPEKGSEAGFLQNIDKQLSKLYEFFTKKKSGDSSSDESSSTKGGGFNLGAFASSIVNIKKNLTTKFIKGLDKFFDSLNGFSKIDDKKFEAFNEKFMEFTESLAKNSKSLFQIAGGLLKIAGAAFLMSLAFLNPLFAVGALVLVTFVKSIVGTLGEKKQFDATNILKFAGGIALLSLSLVMMNFVPLTSIIKLITFIGLFGIAIKTFNGDDLKKSPIIGFATAIGILTLSLLMLDYVEWSSIAKMILFVGGLGLTLRLFKFDQITKSPIVSFAFAISILTLSLYAMNEIQWDSVYKMILFTAGLGVVLDLFYKSKSGPSPITSFALGIGILTLSMLAMDYIEWASVGKMLLFVTGLGLALKLYGSGPVPSLVPFAFGLGIMVLSMFAMNYLPQEAMFKTLAFIGVLGLLLKLYDAKTNESMLKLSFALGIMAVSFAIIAISPMTIEKAMIFGLSTLFLAGVMIGLGIPAVSALATTGSITMILVAVSSLAVAGVLGLISIIPINFENIGYFMLATLSLGVGFAMLSPLATIAGVSALIMLPVAITSLLIAGSLALIEGLSFTNIGAFLTGVVGLAVGFATLTPFAILGAVGAIAMVPIGVSALMLAGLMSLIGVLTIDQAKLDSFNTGIKSIVDGIWNIGGMKLLNTAAKAILLLPIFTAGLAAALVLESIAKVDITEPKINSFGTMIGSFVGAMVKVINDNKDVLDVIKPGLDSIAKLVSVGSGLVDVVTAFANMNYNEYAVKDGKLQLVGVRKLTDADIAQVGINVGKLIQGLIKPLSVISSDDKVWDFGGGVVVNNPFSGGWFGTDNNSGVNRLTAIGNAFIPLAEATSKLTSMSVFTDSKTMDIFKVGLVGLIDTFGTVITRIGTWKDEVVESSVEKINTFVDGVVNIGSDDFKSITETMNNFLNALADNDKWTRINKNLSIVGNNFKTVATNINMINLEKALTLQKTLELMSSKDAQDNFKEIVEQLKELIGIIGESQKSTVIVNGSGSSNSTSINSASTIEENNKFKEVYEKSIDEIKSILSDIATKIEGTNDKLSNKLKVVSVGINGNQI